MMAALRTRVAAFGTALRRTPVLAVGTVLVAFWITVAIFAPFIAPFPPNATLVPMQTPLAQALLPQGMRIDATVAARHCTETAAGLDCRRFLLGTDMLGRDIFSRIVHGARTVLFYAPVATLLAYAVGVTMGLVAGYHGGWRDDMLSFVSNVILSFPVLVLYMLIISTIGASGMNVLLAVVFATAPGVMRIVRGLAMDQRDRDYVLAARTRGERRRRILFVEILPNISAPLIVDFCVRIGYVTITIGVLGFLGLGLPPPNPDWGGMVNEARQLAMAFPHMALIPCIAISSLVLGFNLMADGLNEWTMRD